MSEHEKHEYEELFVRQLNKLISDKNVSQRSISLDLGLSESYINKLMGGYHLPKMVTFFWICDYLNIHPKTFFDEDSEKPIQIGSIMKNLPNLSDEQLSYIDALVKDLIKK